jgi:hypothetical protein
MAIFWRVQNSEGKGPYGTAVMSQWCKDRLGHGDFQHPTLFDMLPWTPSRSPIFTDPNNACGFRSEEQASQWFSKAEMKRLKKLGYTLQQVEGDLIVEDGRQVYFRRVRPLC